MTTRGSIKYSLTLAVLTFVGLGLLAPSLLDSQLRGGGGGGKGGGSRVSSGSSVRQSRAESRPTPQRSASRPSTGQANRPTTGDRSRVANSGNRATNIDNSRRTNVSGNDIDVRKRDVNINGDVNIGRGRDYDNVWVHEGNIHVYEDYEGWKVFAGVTTAIAIGTMLARPPTGYTTVYVGPTPYYYYNNAYYSQVYSSGEVAYQVVAPPMGVVITTLPTGCAQSGLYWTCGSVYYQRSGSGYAVIANPF